GAVLPRPAALPAGRGPGAGVAPPVRRPVGGALRPVRLRLDEDALRAAAGHRAAAADGGAAAGLVRALPGGGHPQHRQRRPRRRPGRRHPRRRRPLRLAGAAEISTKDEVRNKTNTGACLVSYFVLRTSYFSGRPPEPPGQQPLDERRQPRAVVLV